jgi:prepilin-type processing-associated H-X9-DG protein
LATVLIIVAIVVLGLLLGLILSARTIQQGFVGVTTVFGRYRRVLRPGLNFMIPFVETVQSKVSVQNRAIELEFQAITQDQANVYFKAMLLYAVHSGDEETIKSVAFKFVSQDALITALVRTVEGTTRGFVATKRQAEILALRSEIVQEAKSQLDDHLLGWGYHLLDLQLNDITFDRAITESMAQVVASNNLKAAAINEGDALLIRETKRAEAEGAAIRIAAEAEATAARLRGEGIAMFRREVTRGLADAATEMERVGGDQSLVVLSMWTEAMRGVAQEGRGNVIFFDGSVEGMERTIRQLTAITLDGNAVAD